MANLIWSEHNVLPCFPPILRPSAWIFLREDNFSFLCFLWNNAEDDNDQVRRPVGLEVEWVVHMTTTFLHSGGLPGWCAGKNLTLYWSWERTRPGWKIIAPCFVSRADGVTAQLLHFFEAINLSWSWFYVLRWMVVCSLASQQDEPSRSSLRVWVSNSRQSDSAVRVGFVLCSATEENFHQCAQKWAVWRLRSH